MDAVEDFLAQHTQDEVLGLAFLEHHGIKGQKWGIRNKSTHAEIKIRNKRIKLSDKRRHLSDEDIQRYINRLQNEKKLKQLVNEDLHPGRTAVNKFLGDAGHKIAKAAVVGGATYVIKKAIEKKFGFDAASFVAPKPKNK